MKHLSLKMAMVYGVILLILAVSCTTIDPIQLTVTLITYEKYDIRTGRYIYTDSYGTEYSFQNYVGKYNTANLKK